MFMEGNEFELKKKKYNSINSFIAFNKIVWPL